MNIHNLNKMKTRVHKWGNSLAIRIPKSFAMETNIKDGSTVDLNVVKGNLVARPLGEEEYTLKQLVAKINKDNLHRETDTGDAAGEEIW
jgi:antitoxin MazE